MPKPELTIEQGKLEGLIKTDLDGNNFFSFQGIPYAHPPLGTLRFKPSVPAGKWTGTINATSDGSPSISRNFLRPDLVEGGEDCLFLNVFTRNLPSENSNPKRPVMFWIHGGAYVTGSNSTFIFGPEFLLTEDVVLVTINYRLGLLGFFSLEDPKLNVGNAAMYDMILALKWVQKNIAQFGGNPENVTVFGESAGASATHSLFLSPLAQGLFHKVIMQSGCALNGFALGRNSAKEVAKLIGIEGAKDAEILAALNEKTPTELFKIQEQLIGAGGEGPQSFAPVAGNDFWPQPPLELVKSGRFPKDMPVMMGYNDAEGIICDADTYKSNKKITDPDFKIPEFLGYTEGTPEYAAVKEQIVKLYLRTAHSHNMAKYNYTTDFFFLIGIMQTVLYQYKSSKAPLYLYRVALESDLNIFKSMLPVTEPGTCHVDEIFYLFKTLLTPDLEKGSLEEVSVRRFVKLWTNFAKYGNPTPEGKKDTLLNVKWKPVTDRNFDYLRIEETLSTGVKPDHDRTDFWINLLKKCPNGDLIYKL